MRLFLKHILRSMRKKPIQPLVLILTLAISVAVCIFSFTMKSMMHEEITEGKRAGYGNADITVSLSGVSKSRFMYADRVEELIGDRGRAVGCFEFAAVSGDDDSTVICTATRLDRISDFFDFRFVSLTPITPATESECAFVTSDFALEHNLKLGDSFEIKIGGKSREYRIYGISELKFMSSSEIMVDITGVMRTITSDTPIFSALGDSFKPSSIIYVDVKDGYVDECMDILRMSDEFGDKSVRKAYDQLSDRKNEMAVSAPMEISILLTAILTMVIAFTCLYILSVERTEENNVFITAGARPWMMTLSQYIEVLIYWFIGGSLGLALALPLSRAVISFAGYQYATGRLLLSDIIFSELSILIVCLVTVAIFTVGRRGSAVLSYNRDKKTYLPILSTVAYIICYVLVFVLDVRYVFSVFIITVVLIAAVSLTVTPAVLSLVTGWLGNRADKRLLSTGAIVNPVMRYAPKNVSSVSILKNTARLFSMILTVLLSLLVVMGAYTGIINGGEQMLCGDYAVINSSESCYERLSECDKVECISRVYIAREKHRNDIYVNIISADNATVLGDVMDISELPRGNKAVISRANALMLSLDVGDSFSISLEGMDVDLVVSEIRDSGVQFVLFDAEHFNIPYNMLVANRKDGVSDQQLYEQITSATSLEMAAVISVHEVLEENIRTSRILLRAASFILVVSSIFMLVGMINNLVESYRFRREEFELYRIAGMSARDIRRMKMLELIITFSVGGLVGIALFVSMLFSIQKAMTFFGMDIFGGFKDYLMVTYS